MWVWGEVVRGGDTDAGLGCAACNVQLAAPLGEGYVYQFVGQGVDTRSARSLGGTVVAPVASMEAGIHVVRDIWRLVAESFSRGPSVAMRIFFVMGRLERFETALLVMVRAWSSCSLVQENFVGV